MHSEMGKVFAVVFALAGLTAYAVSPSSADLRGPFPIMSTPYFEDGSVDNRVSRRYANAQETEGGSFGSGKAWKLDTVEISDRQKAELDLLYREIVKAKDR